MLEEQFPGSRNTAASKIGNGVISLLWQLRCHCNPDHNKVSSLSNTTVVLILPNLCFWRRSLRSNVGGIDPEKLYRATLTLTLFLGLNITWFEILVCDWLLVFSHFPSYTFIRLFRSSSWTGILQKVPRRTVTVLVTVEDSDDEVQHPQNVPHYIRSRPNRLWWKKKNGLQLEMSGLIFSRSFIPNVEAVAKQIAASPFFEVSLNPKEKFFLKVALTFLDWYSQGQFFTRKSKLYYCYPMDICWLPTFPISYLGNVNSVL